MPLPSPRRQRFPASLPLGLWVGLFLAGLFVVSATLLRSAESSADKSAPSGRDLSYHAITDGDGRADRHETVLTGFGTQDSHLFPHQFLRQPGGWIFVAQGLFNYSSVRRPDPTTSGAPSPAGRERRSSRKPTTWGIQ